MTTWYSDMLDKLESIGFNTSATEINISSIVINTSESLVEVSAINSNVSYGFRFGGQIYHNFSGANNNASRFESTSLLLRDFVISGKTQDMNLGDVNNQSFVLTKDSTWGGTKLNLNSLWFRNSSTDTNGYLAVLATRE